MPDLSNFLLTAPPHFESTTSSSPSSPSSIFMPETDPSTFGSRFISSVGSVWKRRLRFPSSAHVVLRKERRGGKRRPVSASLLEEHVKAWVKRKVAAGVPEKECVLPFLTACPKMVECRLCKKNIIPGDELLCSIDSCRDSYHRSCVKVKRKCSKKFKCPQHACFCCSSKKFDCRCVRCFLTFHFKCSPWQTDILLTNRHGRVVCWRHPFDWRLDNERADPTSDMEEVFRRLPLPYAEEEYTIGSIKDVVQENNTEPAPYIHIRRNFYLIKRKRGGVDTDAGCTSCNANSNCSENCECRGLSLSCSKACHCSEMCTNRPFRKEKRIKVVKTNSCGWGAVALESIHNGDFVIEYVGEVIDDALCEQRLWDMKRRGDQNFYMCEIQKDFTIDATFKGNNSRFLNHSCEPNCKLEKWQVDGETRVGVFAVQSIKIGDPLTYDYRFVQFGPMVECFCGASNCQGFLGSKKKTSQANFSNPPWGFSWDWGCKRIRSPKFLTRK